MPPVRHAERDRSLLFSWRCKIPNILVDNRRPGLIFDDSNRVSDSLYNFANNLFQAPIAAAQVEQQRKQQALEDLWHQQSFDRQTQQDALANAWREKEYGLKESADSRAERGQIGTGLLNAAKLLFSGTKGETAHRDGWAEFQGEDGKPYLFHRGTGQVMPASPSTGKLDAQGNLIPGSVPKAAAKPPVKTGQSFWDIRRSGSPGGPSTLGDVLGGRWWGNGEASSAPAPATAKDDVQHHATNIAEMIIGGDTHGAVKWIQKMKQEKKPAFVEDVKKEVKAQVAAQQAQPNAR